jgi:lipopolysaccharide export LptBFGC system permease protein LptF
MAKTPRYTNEDVYQIGQNHRAIIWLILLQLLSLFARVLIPTLVRSQETAFLALPVVLLPLMINLVSLFFVYRLASSLKTTPWLYLLLGLIPCISLLALLRLSARAQEALKSHGVAVGLMGAKHADLERLLDEAEEAEEAEDDEA